jgi:hypothetical protein
MILGIELVLRMIWNALCFQWADMQMYALLFYIHAFCPQVEEEENNGTKDDGGKDAGVH